MFTERVGDFISLKSNRPALVISSTSWYELNFNSFYFLFLELSVPFFKACQLCRYLNSFSLSWI